MKRMMTVESFWSKVDKKGSDECWNWKAGKRGGYGIFHIGSTTLQAHRFAWELFNESKIPEGKFIIHSCDNKSCCNPNHLRCGTPSDNSIDMAMRKRGRRSKMSTATIVLLRGLQKLGFSLRHAALLAEVSFGQVHHIWNSEKYRSREGAYV